MQLPASVVVARAFSETSLLQRRSMKKGKTKLTRHDAERLFEGLPAGNAKVSSRPENPFGDELFDVPKRADDEAKLWKDSLITLPIGIELPADNQSVPRATHRLVAGGQLDTNWKSDETVFPEFGFVVGALGHVKQLISERVFGPARYFRVPGRQALKKPLGIMAGKFCLSFLH